MWGRTGKGVVSVLAVALATTMLLVPAGGAAEDVEQGSAWLVDVNGHPVEPYAQIPKELHAGAPFSWVTLEGTDPLRCGAYSVIYDPSVLADGVAAYITNKQYENPTKSQAINPETSYPAKAEWSTFPNGPATKSECATTTSGVAQATWGRYLSKDFSVESASSDSTGAKVADQDVIVTETTNKVQGLKLGDLSIGSVVSWLKVEFPASAEPKVSYRVEVAGINDGKTFSGASKDGIVVSGQGVAGSDVIKQFNQQVKAQDQSAFEALGNYGLRILEPRIGITPAGRYVFEVSALDGVLQPAARRGVLGQGFGFRLGASRAAGRYEFQGEPGPRKGYGKMEDPLWENA